MLAPKKNLKKKNKIFMDLIENDLKIDHNTSSLSHTLDTNYIRGVWFFFCDWLQSY